MEGPDEHAYHTYAYTGGVADWLNSTTTDAHVNGSLTDDPTEHDADAFYRSYNPPSANLQRSSHHPDIVVEGVPTMTTTSRQRQTPLNGAPQATAKSSPASRTAQRPGVRSASGPAPSTLANAKPNPTLPSSRPPVRSLVQKFDSSANSSPAASPASTSRTRPPRSAPHAKPPSTSSPARPGKEQSYGSYKFNNLKPRERPQPAPASPAASRRMNGTRQSIGSKASGSRAGLSGAASTQNLQSSRQPFFGEVVGGQDGLLGPGYGIANFDHRRRGSDSGVLPSSPITGHSRSQSNVEDFFQATSGASLGVSAPERTASAGGHRRSHSDIQFLPTTGQQPNPSLDLAALPPNSPHSSRSPSRMADLNSRRGISPPSRIPVPTTRRTSVTSDSSSSIQSSSRAGSALGHTPGRESRPRGRYQLGKENVPQKLIKSSPPLTLTSKRYGGTTASKPANGGNSLKAVIHAPPQPTSPRLRHSRDRQPVSMASTSASRARSTGRHAAAARDQLAETPKPRNNIPVRGLKVSDRRALIEKVSRENLRSAGSEEGLTTKSVGRLGGRTQTVSQNDEDENVVDSPTEHVTDVQHSGTSTVPQTLTLDTSSLPAPNSSEPMTADTEFEHDESPVLGMPGGFAMTPPLQQTSYQPLQQPEEHNVMDPPRIATPPAEDARLSPQTFQQLDEGRGMLLSEVMKMREQSPVSAAPTDFDNPSEIDDSESIQIMLRDTPTITQNRQPWPSTSSSSHLVSIDSNVWRAEALDPSRTISYLEDEESPIDPFNNRSSLRPDDSVSVAFGGNRDDRTPEWTPTMPSMPEHSHMTLDSEAYSTINRVLEHYHNSDMVTPEMAHSFQQQVKAVSPALAQHKDWDSKEATETYLARLLSDANGVAPLSPAKSMPHTPEVDDNRASVGFNDLMASPEGDYTGTAIIYSQPYPRDSAHDTEEPAQLNSRHYRPTPPPKDWRDSPSRDDTHTPTVDSHYQAEGNPPRTSHYDRPQLPEIQGAGEGLGLAINVGQRSSPSPHKQSLTSPPPQAFSHSHMGPPPPSYGGSHHNLDQAMRSPPSPSVYSRHPPSSIFPSAPPPLPHLNTRDQAAHYQVKMEESPLLPPHAPPSVPASEASPKMAVAEEDSALLKRLKDRRNRVKEILDTESIFLQDMMVVEDIYKATSTSIDSVKEEDRNVLFGNSADIVEFSKTFLAALKPAVAPIYTLPKSNRWNFKRGSFSTSHSATTERSTTLDPPRNDQDRMTNIGAVFGRNMASLEKVFGDYLKNLDLANQRLASLQDKPKVKVWLEECHNYASDITQAWSLDSLLVKPLQRITRYPLLLDSLISTTPADHPDYADLVSAKKELLNASVRINETKKRAELVDSVVNRKRKESDGRMPTGISKAFGRRTEKLKVSVGLTEHFEDPDYDIVAQKFGGHFFQLQIVMRDVEKYMDDVQSYVDQCNSQVAAIIEFLDVDQTGQMRPSRDLRIMSDDYTEIESRWRKYGQTMLELTTIALPEHKAAIRKSVIDPIMTLWKLHDQPQKFMQKRKKRLPEYAKYKQAKDKAEKLDKKARDAGRDWEDLNESLKLELPQLYTLTKKLIERCLLSLINIQITWQSTCERKLQPTLERPPERTGVFSNDMQVYTQRFTSDYDMIHARIQALSCCNKSLMTDISNFLSPAQTFVTDDSSSFRKPSTYSGGGKRTQSLGSDVSTPDMNQRNSGNFTGWQPYDHTPPIDGQYQSSSRMRAGSAISSRGPSTPRSQATTPAISTFPQRPSTGAGRSATEGALSFPRLSLEMEQRNHSGSASGFLTPSYSRTSGVFSSALPMSDSPTMIRNEEREPEEAHKVLFLAASLFEFNIAHDRQEAGFPYLVYVPGEIFDVVAQKGELWLARNQDDTSHTVGWIWEKHFARILPDEG